jgi:hypothetical protein
VFNPDGPLVAVKSDIDVTENTATALSAWPGNPALRSITDPYNTAIVSESFNRGDSGVTCLGQTFSLEADLKLQEISLYAGDGLGTIEDKPVTLALYELNAAGAKENATSYTAGRKNLLGPDDGLQINYKPQPRGLLRLRLAESRQPVLKAGKRYVLELQGVRGSAPLFWRRTLTDVYPAGAAYQDRMLIQDATYQDRMPIQGAASVSGDFAMALYGETQVQH